MDSSIDSGQEFPKEKLLSKLFLTFHTLTYSCCSEEVECLRQFNSISKTKTEKLVSTFGIERIACGGKLLILPSSYIDTFNGRIGRLRYFALCVMIATIPLSLEVVQLSLDFPVLGNLKSGENEYRAPIVYPILCGHVLTHVVAALCASCGCDVFGNSDASLTLANIYKQFPQEEGGKLRASNTLDDCISFIQLGYLARVLQVILGFMQRNFASSNLLEWNRLEQSVYQTIKMMLEIDNTSSSSLKSWDVICCKLLLTALKGKSSIRSDKNSSIEAAVDHQKIMEGFELAKEEGNKYLSNICLIFQILCPKASSIFDKLDITSNVNDIFEALNMSFEEMLSSALVCEIVRHWYETARPREYTNETKQLLDCKRNFKAIDWPLAVGCFKMNGMKGLPLFQGTSETATGVPRMEFLPNSYTDLYAEVGALKPNCESVAVCLVCGKVSILVRI